MHRSEYDRLNDVAMRKIGDITSQIESGLLTEEEGTQQAHAVIEEVQRKTAEYQEEKRPSPGSSRFGKATGLFAVLAAMALARLAYGVFV
jgi:hypothetical protein